MDDLVLSQLINRLMDSTGTSKEANNDQVMTFTIFHLLFLKMEDI